MNTLSRSPEVNSALRAFHRATGWRVQLVPADASAATLMERLPRGSFWRLITRTPEGFSAWQAFWTRLHARLRGAPLPCQAAFAGLVQLAVPVKCDGQLAAILWCEPVLKKQPTDADFDRVRRELRWRRIDFDLTTAKEAYFKTRVALDGQLGGAAQLLRILTKPLADSGGRMPMAGHASEPASVTTAKAFVSAHLAEAVRTRDAARAAHLSLPHFCRVFRTATGMTFTEYVARRRVEKACQLLEDSSRRIGDIAFAAGFQSIPHFDRMFKRYVGKSPKEYRVSLRR